MKLESTLLIGVAAASISFCGAAHRAARAAHLPPCLCARLSSPDPLIRQVEHQCSLLALKYIGSTPLRLVILTQSMVGLFAT
jgi:hypothetical protein